MSEVELYLGDCIEVMDGFPEKSIDLFLCDLPYGTTPLQWDSVIPFTEMWTVVERIRKDNTPILFFGQEPFSSMLRSSMLKEYRYDWYWEKERLTNVFQVKRRPGKIMETISVFYKKQPTYNPQFRKHTGKPVSNGSCENAQFSITQSGNSNLKPLPYVDNGTRYPTQLIKINRSNPRKRLHPTEKPVELLEYLIMTYTNEGDTVLDFCMGSGSTGVACLNTNRKFIGIEKNEDYFKIAEKRIYDIIKDNMQDNTERHQETGRL